MSTPFPKEFYLHLVGGAFGGILLFKQGYSMAKILPLLRRLVGGVKWLARYVYPPPTQAEIDRAIENGMAWVRTQQNPDNGSWYWGRPERGPNPPEEPEMPNVGMTGFAVLHVMLLAFFVSFLALHLTQ